MMLSASPSASASSLAAVAHRRPRWTSPRATPSLPTTTMLSTLSSLHPQPRTKTLTSARRWRSKACVSAHSRTVPLPPTSRCRAAATAAASVLLSRESVPIFMTRRSVVPPKIGIRCVGGGLCERHFLDFFAKFFFSPGRKGLNATVKYAA